MSESKRLPPQFGEWIDRGSPVRFTFEGAACEGFAGDTVSSALHAGGALMLGRSFKYHRPRGVHSLANHDVNAMFEDGTDTNIRADVTAVRDGAEYRAVNTVGGLANDRLRIMDAFSRFLPVGFYYKTFHRPMSLFPFWERQLRSAAGLGKIDGNHKRNRTPKRYDWCDVLVIGAGPSGLSAAIAAARAGASVVCVDENARPGGTLSYAYGSEPAAQGRLDELLKAAASLPNLSIRCNTLAAGYYADHWVALVDGGKMTKMRTRAVVFAQGAAEQPSVFRHNDLPGVMLASGAQRLLRRYSVRPFESPLVVTANADGYRAALDFASIGIHVAGIVDLRPDGEPSDLDERVKAAHITIHHGQAVYEAVPRDGLVGIKAAVVCPLDKQGELDTDDGLTIACDGIAMSVGWAGADGLLYQAGGRMKYSDEFEQFVPETMPAGVFAAGRVNGVFALDQKLIDGERAGLSAAKYLGLSSPSTLPEARRGPRSTHPYPIFYHPKGKAFIDLDEDVQLKDLVNAETEGFDNIELLKRYTTFGMGPSQGKIANANTVRVLARLRKQSVGETGVPTSRPFWHPVRMDALAGRGFHPHRHTPMHSFHESHGAVFMLAGDWQRPAYYARPGRSREECITTEVEAVRHQVGMIDVGTLGKIEISGPDAGAFLERIYTGRFTNLKVGSTRYALMCDESGVVIDDGVVARLGEDRFYATTTTSAAASVYREMQRYAIVWGMNLTLVNATGLYGGMNLAGPFARRVLQPLTDIDASETAFPYMGMREGTLADVPARFLRVGFVGELGYEVHVPANCAKHAWDALVSAGGAFGIRPFGVEAQRVLRLEKGHAIVSQDTDGLTNPFEAGMEWAIKDDKPFFIGQRSLRIIKKRPIARRLVAFSLGAGYHGNMPKECHLVIDHGKIIGRVTSIAISPTLHEPIGLAFMPAEKAAVGTPFSIRIDDGEMVAARVVKAPFYDPHAARQKM
ncbi:MAG: (2Fe-2S)-binding protein [Planctomycetes bacterium]|nr:(2Fe-2S)-binding protein [Planctomycetota bacterium]